MTIRATEPAQGVSETDLAWADVVLVMADQHESRLLSQHRESLPHRPLFVLDVPHDGRDVDAELVALLGPDR